MVISTRKFIEATDAGFILDSMPKEIYFDSKASRKGRINKKWFEEFHQYLLNMFKDGVIFIATTQDDPDFILGYSIFWGKILQFVYVKEAYRKQGIGTMLEASQEYSNFRHDNLTKLGAQILNQRTDHKEELLTKQETPTMTDDHWEKLIKNAIPIIKVTFQSAILSGFNTAEFQLSTTSGNKMRVADKMWLCPFDVAIEQNGHRFAIPKSNVIQTDIK